MNTATTARSTVNTVVVGFALGVLVAVPAVMAAVASGGAGHGNYVAARALFPAPMLLTLFEGDRVGAFSVVVGLLQFPIYGMLLGWSIVRKNWVPAIVVTLAHIIAASVCFAGTSPNFS
jgi:hypothetical protein